MSALVPAILTWLILAAGCEAGAIVALAEFIIRREAAAGWLALACQLAALSLAGLAIWATFEVLGAA